MKLDCPLIVLAYLYLEKKRRTTHIQYTIADLLETCERILQWSEHNTLNKKEPDLEFKDGVLTISERVVKNLEIAPIWFDQDPYGIIKLRCKYGNQNQQKELQAVSK
jgi:hypothetical protein